MKWELCVDFFGAYEIVWIAYTCSEGNVSISDCERWHRYLIIKGRWCIMSSLHKSNVELKQLRR